MIFVDTGYLLALVDRRDGLHTRAVQWSRSIREPLLLTNLILLETVNALADTALRPASVELVNRLKNQSTVEILHVDASMFQRGLDLLAQRLDKGWSLTDCISFVVMKERGVYQALSHDHHFQQAGFEALLRRDP